VSRRRSPYRLALALLAGAFALGALRPDWALLPLHALVALMREPSQAVPVARLFLGVCAIVVLAAAIWWDGVIERTARGVAAIDAWSPRTFWITVAGLTLVPRVIAAIAIPYEPASDAFWYHEVAQSIAQGGGVAFQGEPTAFRSPGYAWLLSIFYRVGGVSLEWAWVVGACATAVLLASIFSLAKRLYGPRVGRVATLLVAVYPALVLMTGQTMSDLVFVAGLFAVFAFVAATDGARARDALIVGIAVGVLTLVRTVGIACVVLFPLMWWRRGSSLRIRGFALVAIGCALLVVPWMLRNAAVLDRFTLGTNGGSNILVGHRADATGWRDVFEQPPAVERARNEVERDDAMRAEALRFMREHPLEALALIPRKFVAMYITETDVVTAMFQGMHRSSERVRHLLQIACQLAWMTIAGLVLVRLLSWRNRDQRPVGLRWSGWLLTAYFTAICLVFFGTDRYRLPVLPWLLIEAAVVLAGVQPRSRSINPLSSSSDAN
jgi:4-amino-4-deoxy-L-arabinose transferase-like glycosyltransferase